MSFSPLLMREFYVHDDYPMYVQRLTSSRSDPHRRVVFVHGGVHTGVFWTTTPDGRPGWAQHMASRGWTVDVVDWPGVGRSARPDDFLTSGPRPIIEALAELFRSSGPAVLIGHSIGAAVCVKVLDVVPELVSGFVAVAPAPPAILETGRPMAPEDQPVRFDEAKASLMFANADRFPHEALKPYLRSLCDMSPSVFNACRVPPEVPGAVLRLLNKARVQQIPSLVLAGDSDQLTPEPFTRAVAALLRGDHVTVGRDWQFTGYSHMMPVEHDSEAILFKALEHLEAIPHTS